MSEKQKAMRRLGIGASEIAGLAGLSAYSTPAEIYARKVFGTETESTIPMELGDLLEEPLAQLYAKRTGRWLIRVDTMRHATKPLAIATPDRAALLMEVDAPTLADAERLVQIKTTSWRSAKDWGAPGSDEVPEDYLAQVTWEMAVAGVPLCDVAVLFDRERFDIFTVPYSDVLFEGLYEMAARFWRDHVAPRTPPPADASDRYREALGKMYPRELATRCAQAPAEIEAELHTFALYRQAAKLLERELKRRGNAIRAAIGEGLGFEGSFGKVTWKRTRDGKAVDWRRAASEAHTLAALLLHRFGPQLEAAEREDLEQRVRGLVASCTQVKPGTRRLLPQWAPGFLPELPPPLDLTPLVLTPTTSTEQEEEQSE